MRATISVFAYRALLQLTVEQSVFNCNWDIAQQKNSHSKSFSVSALTSSYPTIWTLTLRKRERQACHNLYVLAKLKDVHFTTAAINVQNFWA
jgi:hypothetical protein